MNFVFRSWRRDWQAAVANPRTWRRRGSDLGFCPWLCLWYSWIGSQAVVGMLLFCRVTLLNSLRTLARTRGSCSTAALRKRPWCCCGASQGLVLKWWEIQPRSVCVGPLLMAKIQAAKRVSVFSVSGPKAGSHKAASSVSWSDWLYLLLVWMDGILLEYLSAHRKQCHVTKSFFPQRVLWGVKSNKSHVSCVTQRQSVSRRTFGVILGNEQNPSFNLKGLRISSGCLLMISGRKNICFDVCFVFFLLLLARVPSNFTKPNTHFVLIFQFSSWYVGCQGWKEHKRTTFMLECVFPTWRTLTRGEKLLEFLRNKLLGQFSSLVYTKNKKRGQDYGGRGGGNGSSNMNI